MLTDQTFFAPPLFLVGESVFFDEQGRLQFPMALGFRNAIGRIEFRMAVVASVPIDKGAPSRLAALKDLRLPALLWRDFDPADFSDYAFLKQTVQASDFVLCQELPDTVVVPRDKQITRPWDFMVALQHLAVSPVPYSAKALRALYD